MGYTGTTQERGYSHFVNN